MDTDGRGSKGAFKKPPGGIGPSGIGNSAGSELVDALEFDDDLILYDQIRNVFAHQLAPILNRVGDLSIDRDAT
jgi:hypothetical protein